MSRNLQNQISKIIDEDNAPIEELKAIEPILREHMNKCVADFYKSYFFTIAIIIIWFLINNSIINELEVMNIKINNQNILLLSLPLIAAIMFYRANSLFVVYQLIDSALKSIYVKIFPNFGSTTLVYFLEFPSFVTLEDVKTDLAKNKSFFNMLGFLISIFILNFLPIIIIGIISVKLINIFWFSWFLIFPFLTVLLLLKICFDISFGFKQL
jgi:hypothetical protein